MKWRINKLNNWEIELIAPSFEARWFKHTVKVKEYAYWSGRYIFRDVEDFLYKSKTDHGFIFGIGFSSYLLYNFYDNFDEESRRILSEYNPVHWELDGLYDFQQKDLDELLKFERGIFQCYTGYGKTEIIAALINYICNYTNLNLLVLTPSSKSYITLQDRLNEKYQLYTDYFDYDSNVNIINVNGFPKSNLMDDTNIYWSSVDIIIADEVDASCTDTAMWLMDLCINCKRSYGFSATADKKEGERIQLQNGLTPVVARNKWMINYFGFSSVYKVPEDFVITETNVMTTLFQDIHEEPDSETVMNEIIWNLYTDPRFCRGLAKIVKKEKGIFVPMHRLGVIDHWVENYFNIPNFVAVVICSRGVELYVGGEFIDNISFKELNDLIDNDVIDIITGTKSAFNSIDMPNLKKAMILHSSLASVVIQAIGRVTRGKKFSLINLIPYRSVAVYSRDLIARNKLIHNYYKQCKFIIVNKKETDYGIY